MNAFEEKVLCYIGPSLPLHRTVDLCPNVIFRPPANQGDILSDAVEIQPDRVLLVDGNFLSNLSPWHKEIIFCLSKEIKVYGASSMGALRAADLWRQGMIGAGKIFEWYKDGMTEDDSEVALLYSFNPSSGVYRSVTVPLVNVRATLDYYAELLAIDTDHQEALLVAAKDIHFTWRTLSAIRNAWHPILGTTAAFLVDNLIDQKAADAEWLLTNYQSLQPDPAAVQPTEESISKFFLAQYDRDRRVTVSGTHIVQQHIEAYIALQAVDHHQIFWDAKNFYLAHLLAQKLGVQVSEEDAAVEQQRFAVRQGFSDMMQLDAWVRENNFTVGEFMVLILRMATVRKLQNWLSSSLVPVECTKITLDYLKMHNAYSYWARECAAKEAHLQAKGADENMSVSSEKPIAVQLAEHAHKHGLTIDSPMEDFVQETGFSSSYDLMVALERLRQLE